jgi:hypothetical protein
MAAFRTFPNLPPAPGPLCVPIGKSEGDLIWLSLEELAPVLVAGQAESGKSRLLHLWFHHLRQLPGYFFFAHSRRPEEWEAYGAASAALKTWDGPIVCFVDDVLPGTAVCHDLVQVLKNPRQAGNYSEFPTH